MKSKLNLFLVVLTTTLLSSSCAMILLPGNQKGIVINTGNKDAEVYVSGTKEGTGSKVTLDKTRKSGFKQVTVKVPNHKDAHHVMVPKKGRVPGYWILLPLDIVTVYGLVYSPYRMTKYFKYEKEFKATNNYKFNAKTDDQKYIRYLSTSIKIKDVNKDLKTFTLKYEDNLSAEFKKAEAKKYEMDAKTSKQIAKDKKKKAVTEESEAINYGDSEFTENIVKIISKAGYIDTSGKVLAGPANTVGLEATIVSGKAYKAYKSFYGGNSYMLVMSLDIDWIFRDQYNQIIDSVRLTELSDRFVLTGDAFRTAMFDAVEKSFYALTKHKSFAENLSRSKKEVTKMEDLILSKPNSLVKDAKDALKAAVAIKYKDNSGHGSGFAVTHDGYLLTNYHVVAGTRAGSYKDFVVVMPDGKEIPGKVERVDPVSDLALVKVDATFEKSFLIPTAKSFDLLEEVYTVGTPASLELGNTITIGIISSERKNDDVDVIQLNMGITGGNSGGPVFSKTTGNLYGVVSSKLVGRNSEGVSFAVPAHNIFKNLFVAYK